MSLVSSQSSREWRPDGPRAGLLAVIVCAWSVGLSGAASAQQAATPPAVGPANSTVVNLIRQLVQEGVLTQDRAEALIRQAQDEAAVAARTAVIDATGNAAPPQASPSVRVPYIPQIVKNQIRDEVKQDVLREAREQNWAAPDAVPAWTRRFRMNGDFRLRQEWNIFDPRNVAPFANYAVLNAGAPFDLANMGGTQPPILNTTNDRERLRIRARLGLDIDVADGLVAGLRLATGNTTNPVTTNQTLGNTLNKENFTLDRAFLDYRPADWAEFWVGRFANPWLYTELVWDDDIAFDGVAAKFTGDVTDSVSLFTIAGAFPIENTAFNFPDNTATKRESRDKWLYAGQLGLEWRPARDTSFKLAAAYYHFSNIEGKLSAPCVADSAADPCDTDNSRPGFQQQGNTLFAIRNLVSLSTTPPLFQYFGLATQFHDLDVTARLDVPVMGPVHMVLDGDYVKNLAYSGRKIAALNPVNNRGPDVPDATSSSGTAPGPFEGGDTGYHARLSFGYPEIRERWQWNVNIAYRYLESDATPDAFNDSDFHLGGTNAKGYIFGAALGLAHNTDLTARWFSTSEVTSFPYTVDVVQVDLNARF